MHAGWNLAVKRSTIDRFVALWGQVILGSAVALVVLLALGGVNAQAWRWAVVSGVVHVPYTVLLARAYDHGDFSQVYPLARGTGALVAAVGGIALLGDDLSGGGLMAVVVIVAGLGVLVGRASAPATIAALGVALTIGCYTLIDSKGSRASGVAFYGLATGVAAAAAISVYGVTTGRLGALRCAVRTDWRRMLAGGVAQKLTYTFVLAAVRLAPVGYVTAIRESSVVIAALIGWKFLGEGDVRRRLTASAVVLAGLVLLVATA
jgi:uncharacterized membrane protein